jgi:hypothetical protein
LVEIIDQRAKTPVTKFLVGQFDPPLRHEQKGGAPGRVGCLKGYLQTLSRHRPEMIFSVPHVNLP